MASFSSIRSFLVGAFALVALTPVWAQGAAPWVKVEEPWVRGTVAQQKASGAFMRLTLQTSAQPTWAAPVRLVGVSAPVAGVAELHEMAMEGDTMRMRAIAGLPLPAGQTVELKPGGYHLMLMDLKQTLKAGDTVPLTLVFEDAKQQRHTQVVQAPIKALAAQPAAGHKGHHGH